MTDRLLGCRTNFHRKKWPFGVVVVVPPPPWSYLLPLPIFDLTGEDSLSEVGAKLRASPGVLGGARSCRCRDGGSSLSQQLVPAPGARLQLLEEMQPFPMPPLSPPPPPPVLTGSWRLLLSGPTVVTSLAAVHAVSSAQNVFTLHNTRCLIPAFAILVSFAVRVWKARCAFFKKKYYYVTGISTLMFISKASFQDNSFIATEWEIIWRHLHRIQQLLTASSVKHFRQEWN